MCQAAHLALRNVNLAAGCWPMFEGFCVLWAHPLVATSAILHVTIYLHFAYWRIEIHFPLKLLTRSVLRHGVSCILCCLEFLTVREAIFSMISISIFIILDFLISILLILYLMEKCLKIRELQLLKTKHLRSKHFVNVKEVLRR